MSDSDIEVATRETPPPCGMCGEYSSAAKDRRIAHLEAQLATARQDMKEEAAKIAEGAGEGLKNDWAGEWYATQRIAAAIRALKP